MKRVLIIMMIAALSLTLTSCTGSERLKNMAIVQGMGIDINGSEITVTVQYLDLGKGNGKNEGITGSVTALVTGKGDGIKEAVKNAGEKLPTALFFGQNKIIVISDEVDKSYTRQLKAYLIKNKESRPDVLIMKSRGSAADVIKSAQKNTRVPADSVYKQLKKLEKDVRVSEYLAGDKLEYYP